MFSIITYPFRKAEVSSSSPVRVTLKANQQTPFGLRGTNASPFVRVTAFCMMCSLLSLPPSSHLKEFFQSGLNSSVSVIVV